MLYIIISVLIIGLFLYELYFYNEDYYCNRKRFYICYVTISIMLILIAGLRYGIGWDYFNYESMHRIINEGNFYHILIEKKIEFGYVLLNFLIKNFYLMIFLISIVCIAIKFKFIKEYSKIASLSVFLYFTNYFLLYDMDRVRQSIALSIIIISIKYIIDRDLKKFVITVIIASTFHNSAIIFFIAYFIVDRRFTTKFIYSLVGISVISNFINWIPMLMKVVVKIFPKYDVYLNAFNGDMNLFSFRRAIFLIIFTYFSKRYYETNRKINVFLNLYFIGTMLNLFFKPIIVISDRLSTYFNVSEIILVTYCVYALVKIERKKVISILFIIITILYGFYNIASALIRYDAPFTPYKAIFERVQVYDDYNII